MNRKRRLTVIAAAATLGGGWIPGLPPAARRLARAAPPTPLDTPLQGLAGKTRTLRDWAGQLRLVNFWATWCAPCRTEMPLLRDTWEQHADDGFQIIGVALDHIAAVAQYRDQLDIRYPLVMVDKLNARTMMAQFGNPVGAIPFSVLLSAGGEVLARHTGTFSEADLEALLEQHLRRGTGSPQARSA